VLGSEAVTNVLFALATGFPDRALNIVAMSDDIDDVARSSLYGALTGTADPSIQARRFGDALRSLDAEWNLVNECYRVSFYSGDEWKRLLGNPLFAYWTANRSGTPIDKWIHYFPVWERHLTRFRGMPAQVLEIGVYRGGGLDLLRSFLGPDARLTGVDIDEGARAAAGDRHAIEIGDQADPDFLRKVAADHGPFDIVIDDGGHTMRQQVVAVETLFPLMADGGVYLVEDSHTSYWSLYADQGPGEPTFIEWLKSRIDDLHAYHFSNELDLVEPWQTRLAGMHVYDSIAVLDSGPIPPPFSELSGTSEYIGYNRQVGAMQLEVLATRGAAIDKLAAVEADAARVTEDARAAATQAIADAEAAVAQAAEEADARVAHARGESHAMSEEVRLLRGELMDAHEATARLRIELDDIRETQTRLNDELTHTQRDLLGAWGIIQEMRRSRSWRVTSPLRRARGIVKHE